MIVKEPTKTNKKNGMISINADGSPNFELLAKKLEERKAQEMQKKVGKNDRHKKMTIYVRDDIYRSFNALVTQRGQQKVFVNQALSDFIQKKSREMGL